MRNTNRPTQRSAEIILPVARLGIAKEVVGPRIRVQHLVAEKFEDAAVIAIVARLGGEAFHPSGCVSVLGSRCCGGDFEFGERFNRRSCLIEGRTRVGTLHAGAVQQNLRAEILPT